MRTAFARLAATAIVATASVASATEISVPIGSPDYALAGDDYLRLVRWHALGGLMDVELATIDGERFGYIEIPEEFEDEPSLYNLAPYVEDVGDCGNDDQCTPYVATFSVPVEAATVLFSGVANLSGSSAEITSASFFLEAWSGPNGTGTLLGRVTDPGFTLDPPAADYTFHPVTVSLDASGMRSIVFGADALTTYHGTQHTNLSWLGGLRLTVIPEPSTGALLALGLVGLAARAEGRSTRAARVLRAAALARGH